MSKKLTFSVTLTFESAINDDNDILEIASNIAMAIKNEEDTGMGISNFFDTYIEKIEVKPQYIDEVVTL